MTPSSFHRVSIHFGRTASPSTRPRDQTSVGHPPAGNKLVVGEAEPKCFSVIWKWFLLLMVLESAMKWLVVFLLVLDFQPMTNGNVPLIRSPWQSGAEGSYEILEFWNRVRSPRHQSKYIEQFCRIVGWCWLALVSVDYSGTYHTFDKKLKLVLTVQFKSLWCSKNMISCD